MDAKHSPTGSRPDRWRPVVICLLLALAVWVVFGQTVHHEFINYDDGIYVYENPVIVQGLSLQGIGWAFTHSHGANWHPLTSISHMLDCQFYGLHPGGHHLTNVLIHTATVILLFLVLHNLTGALWPSAFVAAVFAIHPLRVESVAWVAERKDVLSGLFFVLTVGGYACYARRPFATGRYLLVLFLFTLDLLSKPMVVTLPFVLLLLDYWPLNRFRLSTVPSLAIHHSTLFIEKIPFLALAAAACVATILAQENAIKSVEDLSFVIRFGNALVAYAAYIGQMIYPVGLAVLYPHPGSQLSMAMVGLSALVLLVISAGVAVGWRKHPYLLVGWLWYLGMLVPVIGLMQVGIQARADRYTYLPQIGLSVMLAWGALALRNSWLYRDMVLRSVAAIILAILLVVAHTQTAYWHDNTSLWSHTLACTSGNFVAHYHVGNALAAQGQSQEAVEQFKQALQINPEYVEAHNNLALALASQGKLEEAISHYEQAVQLKPDYADAYVNFGNALFAQGKLDAAAQQYERSLQLNPDLSQAHNNLGLVLARQGKCDAAIPHFERVFQLKPDSAEARYGMGIALTTQGKLKEAIEQFQRGLDLATAQANPALAKAISSRLQSCQSALPQPQTP